MLASVVFLILWVLTGVVGFLIHDGDLSLISNIIAVIFFSHISLVLLVRVFQRQTINFDTIAGAISVYFLIGVIGAFIFLVLLGLDSQALDIPLNLLTEGEEHRQFSLMMYFSFVTLTTLGYGDITPLSNAARIQVYLEALLGQLYLTVLIARLVGQHISQSSNLRGKK
ncbi:MAG: hypothetical protein KZQ58_06135 [gamma proteobacterium symbiont of Bathyaustriella thionipta]|nr:hypothetical protein [gamma proteobacterium symbiont of Bathyaustriella thionipta]